MRLPRPDVARRLAIRLRALDYTVEGVQSLLGPVAARALDRGAAVAAHDRLGTDTSPLATVVRLFMLGDELSPEHVSAAVADDLALADLLFVTAEGGVRSGLELTPHAADGDWLLASDWAGIRTGEPLTVDHVLGAGGASLMLAQCTVRPSVARGLDLGTGCGVQALHLRQHCTSVVATDLSLRCLAVAAFNAAMNDVTCDLRQGSLFAPVDGEQFDLIVSNPPFVIGSPVGERHDYRDSGLPGDEVCARLVAGAEQHLTDGGWCQLLANWEIRDGDDWHASPSAWLTSSGLDAWVVQREVQDPAAYVETWLRDAGSGTRDDYERHYRAWYSGLRARGVVGIGFGLVSLRAGRHDDPVRRFQHVPQTFAQPVGGEVERWFARQDWLRSRPGAEVLLAPGGVAADVRLSVLWRPGAEPPEELLAQRETAFRWSATLDPFGVEVLQRIDPSRPLGEVVAAVAQDEGIEVTQALAGAIPVLRRMIEEGFIEPVG